MIRSVVRASARLTSTVPKSHLPTVTSTSTVLFRSFANTASTGGAPSTPSSASSPSSAGTTSVTTTSTAPAPANLRTLRRDLSRLLDEDASDLASAPDPGLLEFIKEQRYKVTQDKEQMVKMTRQVGDYTLTVTFSPEVDESVSDEQGEAEAEGEEKTEEGEEEEERLPAHSWEVDLTSPSSTPPTVRLNCVTSKHGQFSIESVDLSPSTAPPPASDPFALQETGHRLFFDELSEGAQDKLFEWLEGLGVDDKLGQFVQHYAQVVRTQGYLDKLKQLKSFLQ